ncbi:Transmembrane protein 62 [Tritrichomonas musculus]|uniref:Transmembrane protein 62 n=1 Tax=Tritrichomonas musculus TaxID=1915356 RepID=A0ABR2GML6_9EUKA
METENHMRARTFLNFVSHYLWLLFIGYAFLLVLCLKSYQEVPEIKSKNSEIHWNSSYNPHIFGFISDSHIASYNFLSINDTESILNIYNKTNAEKILFAGDICDNFGSNSIIKHGQQYINDFIIYQKITSRYPNDFIIAASGNHDEFGVDSYNSTSHFILHYVDFYKNNEIYKDYDNFLISKVKLDDIDIFVLNPYQYPTVSAGLGYYMNLTRDMMDKIEKALMSPSNATARLLLTHFPLSYSMIDVKSSSKKTLTDIVASSNITAILAGHSHLELVIHRKTSLEIHTCAVKKEAENGRGYRFISIDNGGLSDHSFNLKGEMPEALLTYPIPKKYISDQTDFSIENFNEAEARVVHFSENPNLNITATCYCKTNDYKSMPTLLQFQRIIRRNQSLYSIPLKKLCDNSNSNGFSEYQLTFSGDWNYSTTFVVSDSVKLDREILDTDVSFHKSMIIIGIICWIIIFIVWCPFPPLKCFDILSDWIAGNDDHYEPNCANQTAKYVGVIFGFLLMKSQIYNNIPLWIQIVYFLFVLSPIFIPVCFLKSGNSYGFIYFVGYYLKSFAFDYWGVILTSYFILFVLLPSTIIFSEIAYFIQTRKCSYSFLIDVSLALLQFGMIIIVAETSLYQATTFVLTICSPLFVIEPIAIIIMEILSFSKHANLKQQKERKIENESSMHDDIETNIDDKIEL